MSALTTTMLVCLWRNIVAVLVTTLAAASNSDENFIATDPTSATTTESPNVDRTCHAAWITSLSLCDDTVNADGNPCAWCEFPSFGRCVSKAKSKILSKYLDDFHCSWMGDDGAANDDDDADDDDDSLVGVQKVPSLQHDLVCSRSSNDIDDCGSTTDSKGDACVWCWLLDDYEWAKGICVDNEQAARLGKWDIECDWSSHKPDETPSMHYDPLEFTCTKEATNEETCRASKDKDGIDCVWCQYRGFFGSGICLNVGQAAYTDKLFHCDRNAIQEG